MENKEPDRLKIKIVFKFYLIVYIKIFAYCKYI